MSSGWRRSLLREAVRCSPRGLRCHRTPGRARCPRQPSSAPSDVPPPAWWPRAPSGRRPRPARCGPSRPLPVTDPTPELWRRRRSGGLTTGTLRGRTEVGQAVKKMENSWWIENYCLCCRLTFEYQTLRRTCVSSFMGAASSLPPVRPIQSRNFSLNRDVSLCSETQPNNAQLGRPSPLLSTQAETQWNTLFGFDALNCDTPYGQKCVDIHVP